MEYEPLKDRAANLIRIFPSIRDKFYVILDLVLLRQRYVKREISRFFSKEDKFLYYDAGAGFCQYSWSVLKKYPNAKVFATDIKGEYLEDFSVYASQVFPGRFSWKKADLQTFIPENKYDLVTAVDILEHISDDIAVLKNFYVCMKERGILIISTPSDKDEAAKFTAEHIRPGYNKKELEDKVKLSGFKILKCIYSYGFWGSLSWRLLIRFPLEMLSKSKLSMLVLPFYYIIILPLAELMMQIDLHTNNSSGTGIILVAQKGSSY